MRTSQMLIELLRWLVEAPKTKAEMQEKHDGRTIASATRRGYIMEYGMANGVFVMLTAKGEARLCLEDGEFSL